MSLNKNFFYICLYIPRTTFIELFGVCLINLARFCQLLHQLSCSSPFSNQQCLTVSVSQPPCQQLALLPNFYTLIQVFLTLAWVVISMIDINNEWFLIVVLTCISLITNEFEYLFLAISLSVCSNVNCLFLTLAHLFVGVAIFTFLVFKTFWY